MMVGSLVKLTLRESEYTTDLRDIIFSTHSFRARATLIIRQGKTCKRLSKGVLEVANVIDLLCLVVNDWRTVIKWRRETALEVILSKELPDNYSLEVNLASLFQTSEIDLLKARSLIKRIFIS
jgi:pyruvate/2-oxoglutarate/acetoin dehydrogenase E1 component